MGTLVAFGIFAVFIWIIARAASAGVRSRNRLAQSGLRGRGLVLASAQMSVGVTINGQRYEQRAMTIEIEIPGRTPYVIQGTFMTPRGLVEGIPGASLEVAVDPNNGGQIAVLGPGGFTGPWLNVGPPQPY